MRWRMLWIPLAALLALPATAQAHVELTPDSVDAGGDALITIKSPNEAKVPLTGLRMTIPEDLVVEGAAFGHHPLPARGFRMSARVPSMWTRLDKPCLAELSEPSVPSDSCQG